MNSMQRMTELMKRASALPDAQRDLYFDHADFLLDVGRGGGIDTLRAYVDLTARLAPADRVVLMRAIAAARG